MGCTLPRAPAVKALSEGSEGQQQGSFSGSLAAQTKLARRAPGSKGPWLGFASPHSQRLTPWAEGRMDFGKYSFPLEELDGVGLCGKAKMVLMYAGDHYELRSTERINALKYVHAYEYITGKQVI